MADHFKRVGLVSRKGSAQVVDTLTALAKFLLARGTALIVETETRAALSADIQCEQVCDRELLGLHCDLVIVVGGDGHPRRPSPPTSLAPLLMATACPEGRRGPRC